MDPRYIVALELSDSQVKGAAATVETPSYANLEIPSIETIVSEDKVNCVQYGRVQNIIDATKHVQFVLQKLENHPKLNSGKITSAYVALAGRSLGSVPTTAELSLPSEMEITEEILVRLYKEATKSISGDKKVLKVLPRKFVVNKQASLNPVGTIGSNIKGEFTVVTCNPANLRNLEMVFNERVKLPVKQYIVTPLALGDLVLSEEEKQLGCVLVDMGAQTTTIAIYKNRALYAVATLPLGSQNITRDIAKGMQTTQDWAEQAKITSGDALYETAKAPQDQITQLHCYLLARVGEIVANIMYQIKCAGFEPTDLKSGFILTGRGCKLKNFSEFLEKQSKMDVRIASVPRTVNINDNSVEPGDYAALISIVAMAARYEDPEGCVEASQPQQKPQIEDPIDIDDDNDDDDVLLDSDREKPKKPKQEKAKEKPEKEKPEKKKKERKRGSWASFFTDKINSLMSYEEDEDDTDLGDN